MRPWRGGGVIGGGGAGAGPLGGVEGKGSGLRVLEEGGDRGEDGG